MATEGPTLRERYAADLRAGSLPVLLTAVPLALVVGLGTALSADADVYATGVPLSLLVGVFVPAAHERLWPQDQGPRADVAWTLAAASGTILAFLGWYALVRPLLSADVHGGAIALLGTLAVLEAGVRGFRPE